jgi:quinol monooxygenase YgiN
MILIVVKFPVKSEYSAGWLDSVAEFTASTRAEPGNIFFEWSRSVDEPDTYVVAEAFQDDAAEAHVTSEHFKTAMAWMPTQLRATPSIVNLQGPGTGWGPMGELSVDS